MDGWVIVGTKLDSKQLEKDIKSAERQLQQYEREAEKLVKQKAKVEIDLEPYEEQKRLIKETTDEMLSKSQTEEQVKNVLEMEQMQLDDLNQKYSKQLNSVDEINRKIDENVRNQSLMNSKINEMKQKTRGISLDFSKVGKEMSKNIKKVAKWALAIFSVQGAYSAIRKAMSTLTQYNEQMANQLNTMNLMLASAFGPLITKIVDFAYTLMSYINYIVKAWFGIDLYAKATALSMNKSAKSAKDMRKSLAGFDEMNVLNDNGTTGAMGNNGLAPLEQGETPEWLEWISEHGAEVIGIIGGIAAAVVALNLGLGVMMGLGIGLLFAGLMMLMQDIIDLIADPSWTNFLAVLGDIAIVVGAIMLLFGSWWGLLVAGIGLVVKLIAENWEKIKVKFVAIGTFFSFLWNQLVEGVKKAIENVKVKFSLMKNFIVGIIKIIINTFKTVGTKIGEVVGKAFKTVINGVLTMVENVINTPIKAINGLLDKINDVPGIDLKKLNTVKLPRLEVGGVVNLPGRGVPVGGAIGGERGAEGVIPLTNTQMMEQLGATIGRYITVNNHITTTLNGRVIGRELKRSENESNFAFNK